MEALARSGVGALDLIDDDKVCLTNLNRQIIATRSTVGQYKVDVAAQRIHDIDPDIRVTTHQLCIRDSCVPIWTAYRWSASRKSLQNC